VSRGAKGAAPSEPEVTQTTVLLALLALLMATSLNVHHLALWCLPLALLGAAWRAWVSRRGSARRAASKTLRISITLVMIALVVLNLRTLSGLAAGASLLVAMITAKLFEIRRRRDWYFIAGATLFLLLTACLDAQQLWRLPLYAANFWLLAATLHGLGADGEPVSAAQLLRSAGRRLLLALPLALLLFVIFPRLPGAFWALPQTEQATTGLSDEMTPGGISDLSESDAPALRVRFEGAPPPPQLRYWRGPVLHEFDGYTWRRGAGLNGPPPALNYSGTGFRYQVALEPNKYRTLVALERVKTPETSVALMSSDYQLFHPHPENAPISYTLESFTNAFSSEALNPLARRIDTTLPPKRNARTVELAHSLRAGVADDRAYIDAVLNLFRTGGFTYTLTPPLLDLDSVDSFLFGTRQGFCGHYASAFVTLMRAAAIPARVVTGYQGGDWNSVGHYLTVRQSHAHAWAEVWLEGQGWVRVDPTGVVAPQRLTRDLYELLGFGAQGAAARLRSAPWIGHLLQSWEAMNAWWQDDVVGFNFIKQSSFLNALGLHPEDWRSVALVLGAGSALWFAWLAWTLRMHWSVRPRDPLARAWLILGRKLGRLGLARAAHEGPIAWGERIASKRPDLAPLLRPLVRRYADLRYGEGSNLAEVSAFGRAVRGLQLARRQPG
jgi:transglutaminase-like putative cysteine protease